MSVQKVCAIHEVCSPTNASCSTFITASYDGCVRVYNSSQQAVATISSHAAPVTSTCWVTPYSQSIDRDQVIASASFDHTLHLTRLSSFIDPTWATLATLHLHTAPVSSVSTSSSGEHLISAGWDNLVGIWTSEVPDKDEVKDVEEAVGRKKRRKIDGGAISAVKKVRIYPRLRSTFSTNEAICRVRRQF